MDCSKITEGLIAAICDQATIGGTGVDVIFLNYSDVDKATSVVTKNVISDIALFGSAKGYKFETLDDSSLGEVALAKGPYFSKVQQDLTLRIFVKTEEAKKFMNNLTLSRVIAIVQNKELGLSYGTPAGEPPVAPLIGSTKYEAYGWDAGLTLNDLKTTTDLADGVVYEFKLGSSDKSKELSLPKSVFVTDVAATDTLIAGLYA